MKKGVGVTQEPGNSNSGGIVYWDHDGDPSTPQKQVVPGIDTLFEDGNGVFPTESLDLKAKGIDPDNVNGVTTVQANPCATSTCTVQESIDRKDNLPDLIVMTGPGEPSYVMLNDPTNPGSLQEKTAIGADEHDERDVKIADVNGDGVSLSTQTYVHACALAHYQNRFVRFRYST